MKTTTPPFEINVALIGYVSVGKTTLLNALLKDKYSEVSMKRCTAGINKFRIVNKLEEASNSSNDSTWTAETVETADTILKKISNNNKEFRDKDELQEETFDIHVEEPLFEMQDNTDLVLIDVPGEQCQI